MTKYIKLLKFDWNLLKKHLMVVLYIMILAFVFMWSNPAPVLSHCLAATLLAFRIIAIPFEVMESNDPKRLYSVLPLSRKQIVVGRYLFYFLFSIITLAVILVGECSILLFKGRGITTLEIIKMYLISVSLFTFYSAILVPGYYYLGAIKGKGLVFVPAIIFGLIAMVGDPGSLKLNLSIVGVGLSSLVLYIISLGVALIIVKKRGLGNEMA